MIVNSNNTTIGESSSYIITDAGENKIILAFDMIEECEFKASTTVTTYPTERGIQVTDYKYDNPDTLKIRCFMRRTENNAGLLEKLNTELEKYKSGIYAMNIQTKIALRSNYTLTGYSIPENADNYGLFEVEMDFQQILNYTEVSYREASDKDTVSSGISQVTEVE